MKPQLIPACALIALSCNGVFLVSLLPASPAIRSVVSTLLVLFCLVFLLRPALHKQPDWQLSFFAGGSNLLLCAIVASLFTPLLYLVLLLPVSPIPFSLSLWIPNTCLYFVLEATLLFHAMARLYAASARLRGAARMPLFLLWWLPVGSLAVLLPIYRTVQEEWRAALLQRERDALRKEAQICATKYPLFFVHGIFIPDWASKSYWGRVPEALRNNGANTHFFQHFTLSATIPERANALKEEILSLLAAESCEKVHIIAHGRGGLDARYAISQLGLGEFAASLTTINTPHRGCRFAGTTEGMPRELALLSEHLFSHMGEGDPDFYSGLQGLTPEACTALNAELPDDPRVLYQSVGSKMVASDSANFPLNLGFQIIKALDGENDGLVALTSMPWGSFALWEAEAAGKWGISHGDMIDLSRKDIANFDLCEHYVQLVAALKDRGL